MIFKLANTKIDLYCEVDCSVYDSIKQYLWYGDLQSYNKKYYVMRRIPKTKKRIYLHRFLLNVTDSKIQVDHVNGDTLNNKISNIRICPRGKYNAINRPKQNNNTSGYKGVFYRKDSKKYRAAIRVDQKLIHLGTFVDPKLAAIRYNEAAIKYFGEFAYLNEVI